MGLFFKSKSDSKKDTEYFDQIKQNLSSIMNYSVSGTEAFNQCDLWLYPEKGGIFVVEGAKDGKKWKELTIKDMQSEIIQAMNRGDYEAFKELIQKVSLNALRNPVECTHKTLLHCAAEQGNIEIAKLLLQLLVPVDTRVNKNTMTPLHAAIIWDQKEMETFLIDSGASLDAKFKNHTAAELRELKQKLNCRQSINAEFDEEKLAGLLEEASHYHFKSRILTLCRRRIGELKAAKNKREQAKKQWTAKQGKKVQVYQEQLDQAVAEYDRKQHQVKAKAEQEEKMKKKATSYYKSNSKFQDRKSKHEELQEKARQSAKSVMLERKKSQKDIDTDPLEWLRKNDGMTKNSLVRN
mmetsp:Transcript_12140/g.18071  ORF Transcript_12140/g.18071 Transcript_12140/m.18071 type:complete len:352 (-) Transcript_12140:1334-2389(-)